MVTRQPGAGGDGSPLRGLFFSMFDNLSKQMAGGARMDLNLLGPDGQRIDPELEGMLPDDFDTSGFLPDIDPAMFAMSDPDQPGSWDLSAVPDTSGQPGRSGEGLDWFRAGQAPNNYANRHNPLYKARAEFVTQRAAPLIAELFPGMQVTGQGYLRPPGGGGGQAANSDHQSAGALDVFGTPEEMAELRNWAVNQPWVSFVRCNSPYHYDHVHISVDIGWVARNVFGQDQATIEAAARPVAPQLPDGPGGETVVPSAGGTRAV